ncbi:MAG: LPP20 family lipoprotein [Bacteriovoracaceae bacterium]|nr:LPP20 family lipoprotein [Bacteriovoracaceae bacterium]
MKTIFTFGTLLFLLNSANALTKPKWVNSPDEFCPPTLLCAVGEGTGQMNASVNARAGIGKIFETKVKSKLDISTSSSQSSDSDSILSGGMDEDTFQKVTEVSEAVLDGVEVTETWESDEAVFALATLHKRKAADRLKSKMDELDEKIKTHFDLGKRSDLSKCLKFLKVRTALDLRYEILKGRRYSSSVSYSDIMKKKRLKSKQGTTILLNFKEVGKISEVASWVTQKLLDEDFKVVRREKRSHQYKIVGGLNSEKQFFNVKGFVRYKFLLTFKSMNKNGEEVGAVTHTVLQTGRSQKQAYQNAVPSIKRFISENLDQLNME